MDVCNPKNRIGYYAPQAGGTSGGGSGTWTITSTETSNVAQSIMYINAVDVQANHGSFTTLTLNGTDFSTDLSSLVTKTQFMSASTSPNTTTFTSAISAPSLTLSGGVFTITTLNATTGTITTLNSTTATVSGTFSLATMPTFTYTNNPTLTNSQLGYNSSTYSTILGTVQTLTSTTTYVNVMQTFGTSASTLPIGTYLIIGSLQFTATASTATSGANGIKVAIFAGSTQGPGTIFPVAPLGAGNAITITVPITGIITLTSAVTIYLSAVLEKAVSNLTITANSSTSATASRASYLHVIRVC